MGAQILLHPLHTRDSSSGAALALDSSEKWRPLLAALVGWSAAYSMGPRLLASLALFYALEGGLVQTPGWYVTALRHSLTNGTVFKKLRSTIQMSNYVSDTWLALNPHTSRPLDVSICASTKDNSEAYWMPSGQQSGFVEVHQRRPTLADPTAAGTDAEVAVIGSLLTNLPNMAGLVRTAESLLGGRAEVALRSDKVLTDPHFMKMSVASERAGHVVAVPEGPRLMAYIREKRANGFLVVALEQTSDSTVLCATTVLPRKVVVVIGDEQQGIPPWLVQSGLVDLFVEIPLLGQTQSLNAHVAAAMLLWHYRLQH